MLFGQLLMITINRVLRVLQFIMRPKISIVIPVYNVEKYIKECLDSIIKQTFTEWECLLIDDGSPDNSGAICDEYVKKDSRFKVYHKQNGGVSSARNYGIEKAQGEWVTFIDSDDFISPTFLEGLYKPIAQGEQLDFVHGGCSNWKDGENAGINQQYEDYVGTSPGYIFENFRGLIVSKLFKIENIKFCNDPVELRFDETMKIAEDMAFTLDYLSTVKKYAFVSEIGYYYRKDNMTSATQNIKRLSFEWQMSSFAHLYNSTISYINNNKLSKQQSRLRLCQRCDHLQDVIFSLYSTPIERNNRLKSLKEIMNSEYRILFLYNEFSLRNMPFIILRLRLYYVFDIIMSVLFRNK